MKTVLDSGTPAELATPRPREHTYEAKGIMTNDKILNGMATLKCSRPHLAALPKIDHAAERAKGLISDDIIGRSESVAALKRQIESFRGTRSSVLITGESGTGKELVARRIWAVEGNPARPFVVVNCGALPENLIESELFGHKKGAFTDASRDKKGAFELADGGDLFLDEVGELPLSAQVKILRAIQEKKIRPVGHDNEFQVNVRIIAATNRDLEEMVEAQQFREDLFFRLNVIRLETAPLRARIEDIEDLVQHFIGQMHGQQLTLESGVSTYLKALPWRGNIRELRNWVERALVNVRARHGKALELVDFKVADVPFKKGTRDRGLPSSLQQVTPESYKAYLLEAERLFVERTLNLAGGNVSQTAESLGTNRTYLHRKLKDLGIRNSRANA